MWILIAVALVAGIGVESAASPVQFDSEAECASAAAAVEQHIKGDKAVKAYALKCVEITPDDVKRGGVDA